MDVDARTIERWLPNEAEPSRFAETLEWRPDAFVPALIVDLVAYFERVTGEKMP